MARLRRPHLLLAALTSLGLLSGCSPDEWGSAASVGEARISVAELQQATKDALAADVSGELRSGKQCEPQLCVLQALVQMEVWNGLASGQGITVEEAEVDDVLGDLGPLPDVEKQAAAIGIPPSRLRDRIRQDLQSTALQERLTGQATSLLDDVRTLGISVNPRYGEYVFTEDDLQFRPLSGGGLSTAIPQPAASPAASAPVDQGGAELSPEIAPQP